MTQGKSLSTGMGILAVLTWGWLAVAVPFLTNASCFIFIGLPLAAAWILLAVIWLFAAPWVLRSGGGRRWWLAAGAAGFLGVVLAFTDVGLCARLAACESSLLAYGLQKSPRSGDSFRGPQWVGLFQVKEVENYQGIFLFRTSQSFLNDEGVAYVPADIALPPEVPRCGFRHLYGQWYWFSWRF